MLDPTEALKVASNHDMNSAPCSRDLLEKRYGQVWSQEEMLEEFEVLGFSNTNSGMLLIAKEYSTELIGTLQVQNYPRYYHSKYFRYPVKE